MLHCFILCKLYQVIVWNLLLYLQYFSVYFPGRIKMFWYYFVSLYGFACLDIGLWGIVTVWCVVCSCNEKAVFGTNCISLISFAWSASEVWYKFSEQDEIQQEIWIEIYWNILLVREHVMDIFMCQLLRVNILFNYTWCMECCV
jgi:hypothetical protein